MSLDPDSLERLVPTALDPADAAAQATLALHVERYEWAARARSPAVSSIAPAASATGRRSCCAIPRSGPRSAWTFRRTRSPMRTPTTAGPRARFVACDALATRRRGGLRLDREPRDDRARRVAERLVAKLVSLLRPGGRLVASVPTTPSVDLNPHHRHDFTAASFRALGARHGLVERDAFVQVQRLAIGSAWRGRRFTSAKLRPNLPGYYAAHPSALARRIATTLRHGLANHYLTVAWDKPA
jgi:hypothetical protein